MLLAWLQRADSYDLAGDFLAALIGNRNHYAIFATLTALGVANRSFDSHGRYGFGLRFRVSGVEPQVVLAPRTYIRALQDHRLAVRTYSRRA
jgi:hypothetical protein